MAQYLGKAPVKKQAVQRISATLDKNGKMNPASEQRMKDDMARQELKNERDYQRQLGLYNNIKASNEFTPTRPGERYNDTQAYAENRTANRELIEQYPQKMQDLKTQQWQAEVARQDAERANRMAQQDARSLIFSGNDPMAQKKILDSGRDVNELTPDYLKSIGMMNQAGTGLYGAGSSGFDVNEGFTGPSIAQRRDLKYYNTALENNTAADPKNAPSVRSMNELMQSAGGKNLGYSDSTVSQSQGQTAFPGVFDAGNKPLSQLYDATSSEPSDNPAGAYGNSVGGDLGANQQDVSSSSLFKPQSKYGKKITRSSV